MDVFVIDGGVSVDDRGSIRFANEFQFQNIKRFYQVQNHRAGFIRAWHGHKKEEKYVWVASGSAVVALVPLDANQGDLCQVRTIVLSEQAPKVLRIPAGHYNGFMSLTTDTRILFFSTSTLEESSQDDIRLPYDAWNIWNENFR